MADLEERSKVGGLGFRLGGFQFSAAVTDRMIDDVFRLRFQSYIKDYRMAPAADFPDQKHADPYDAHALHALAQDEKGNAVGTVRMVLNSPAGFQCLDAAAPEHRAKLGGSKKIVEISRLALAQPFAGAYGDVWSALLSVPLPPMPAPVEPYTPRDRRRGAVILLGLFRMVYRLSQRLRITGWCFMAHPSVAAVYTRHGAPMHALGPVVASLGQRAAHLVRFQEMERYLFDFNRIRAVAMDLKSYNQS